MRSGAAVGHRGYFHQTAFYATDEEFLAVTEPFLREGLTAGEPVVVASTPQHQRLIQDVFPGVSEITYIDNDAQYARPAAAISAYRRLLADYVRQGAQQIRVTGDVPHPGLGVPWDWWARYESAVNVAYDDFPLWGLCPYDTRITPAAVLAHVRRTHPHIATVDGDRLNPDYAPDNAVPGPAWSDPIEATAPAVVLVDPLPTTARAAIGAAGQRARLAQEDISGLRLAVTEVLTNGFRHGRGPTRLCVWIGPDRVVATVTDQGRGPADPLVGLTPVAPAAAGLGGQGLWLAYQMCSYLTWQRDATGFTVRMVAGQVPRPVAV